MRRYRLLRLSIILLSIFTILFLTLIVLPAVVQAGTAKFHWLPNQDDVTTGYEIYCDLESQGGDDGHSLWKAAPMDNIIDGRVYYIWENFPERDTYYCVCVAKGISEGQVVTSGFSNEVEVLLTPEPQIPGVPQDVKVGVQVSVTVSVE